ncbi:MAG TPA: DUF1972 domain-containing protein [Candidatus Acidoferrum sp.]|nr:DUF1972 domain-containing protein [Candidatus Acidoferrum sp.]
MRVAILGARGIPARYGGFETFAEQLAVRLVERGHKVTVFCEAEEGAGPEYRGVTLRHVTPHNVGPLRTVLHDAACLWHARSGFDVVYMLGYGSSAFCWLPRLWGGQVWINMDGLEWARAKWNWVARLYFRWAERIAMWTPSRIVADAAAIKENLASRHRRMPPCDVIPYGCEFLGDACERELASFELAPGSYYLVVCRFEPENHVKEIIKGFLESQCQKRLVLIGDHQGKSEYMKSLRSLECERVLFAGPVYEPKKIQALRFFCSGYLHGHSVGGTNPSLLEAMGCGNLVIAHDNIFNREVLGATGLFFADRGGIAAAIDLAEIGGVDVARMRAAVVERVKKYYMWDRIVDHYCKLLSLMSLKTEGRCEVVQCAPSLSGSGIATRTVIADRVLARAKRAG